MWQWNTDSHQFLRSPKAVRTDWQSQEAERATPNGSKCITLHVIQISASQEEFGLLQRMTPGVSHYFHLAAVFPVSRINIWASAPPEGLIFLQQHPVSHSGGYWHWELDPVLPIDHARRLAGLNRGCSTWSKLYRFGDFDVASGCMMLKCWWLPFFELYKFVNGVIKPNV